MSDSVAELIKGRVSALFKESNRGLLLDIVVFVANLFLMRVLMGYFVETIGAASAGDVASRIVLFLFCVSLMVLPPIGAVLKRWHFHERNKAKNRAAETDHMGGCLFNPIFYFCLTAVIFSTVNAFILQYLAPKSGDPGPTIFIASIFIGIALMITHTVLVYRYFTPPKAPPRSDFLRSPRSEIIGDIALFLNMIFFQLVWNLLSFAGLPPPSGPFDVIGRIFVLVFLALLLYFPPRMIFLADDIGKRSTWFTILLANSPVIFRLLVGAEAGPEW